MVSQSWGRFIREHPNPGSIGYNDRNPVWMAGGVEVDGENGKEIQWSQPEILLYDDDPLVRMSYPDLIEEGAIILLPKHRRTLPVSIRLTMLFGTTLGAV